VAKADTKDGHLAKTLLHESHGGRHVFWTSWTRGEDQRAAGGRDSLHGFAVIKGGVEDVHARLSQPIYDVKTKAVIMIYKSNLHAGLIAMVFPSFNRFSCVVPVLWVLYFTVHALEAMATEQEKDGLFRSLEAINSVPMGESAGSYGTLGLSLGAGASLHTLGQLDLRQWRDLGFEGQAEGKLIMPRIWLTKGLPIPVDVGLSVGASQVPILQQGTGYIQWTMFEGLGLPSVAMRLTHNRLFMAQSTNLTTNRASFAASWTFFRYINLFGTTSVEQSIGETKVLPTGIYDQLALTGGTIEDLAPKDAKTTSTWLEHSASLGVRLTVFPPFVSITGEFIRRGGMLHAAMAKLAIGL
jgi:hypothetical protein